MKRRYLSKEFAEKIEMSVVYALALTTFFVALRAHRHVFSLLRGVVTVASFLGTFLVILCFQVTRFVLTKTPLFTPVSPAAVSDPKARWLHLRSFFFLVVISILVSAIGGLFVGARHP